MEEFEDPAAVNATMFIGTFGCQQLTKSNVNSRNRYAVAVKSVKRMGIIISHLP